MTENDYWKMFFKSLKLSFNIPTRHDLSNKLLTETFDNVTTRVHKRIEDADSIGIQCDAWSGIRNLKGFLGNLKDLAPFFRPLAPQRPPQRLPHPSRF